jgi:hypothetical protein
MLNKMAIFSALPLVLAYGIGEGLWTQRWQHSAEREWAAARLAAVPLEVGDWKGEEVEMPERMLQKAEIEGYLNRRYVAGSEAVTVMVVCGKPGPISVHPPEICYAGQGYHAMGQKTHTTVPTPSGKADFWTLNVQKPGVVADRMQILYAWGSTGDWVASNNPRWQFARTPVLFKMYVIRRPSAEDKPGDDPAVRFLGQFLPELNRALFDAAH